MSMSHSHIGHTDTSAMQSSDTSTPTARIDRRPRTRPSRARKNDPRALAVIGKPTKPSRRMHVSPAVHASIYACAKADRDQARATLTLDEQAHAIRYADLDTSLSGERQDMLYLEFPRASRVASLRIQIDDVRDQIERTTDALHAVNETCVAAVSGRRHPFGSAQIDQIDRPECL